MKSAGDILAGTSTSAPCRYRDSCSGRCRKVRDPARVISTSAVRKAKLAIATYGQDIRKVMMIPTRPVTVGQLYNRYVLG